MRICWANYITNYSVVGISTVSGFGASNLGDSRRSKYVLSSGTSTVAEFHGIFPAERYINVIAMFGLPWRLDYVINVGWKGADNVWHWPVDICNFTNGIPDNPKFSRAADYGGGSVVYWPSPVFNAAVEIAVRVDAPVAIQWTASRLWAGACSEYSMSYDFSSTVVDTSRIMRSVGGSLRTISGARYRRWKLPLPELKDNELEWLSLQDAQGVLKSADRFISVFPGEGSYRETHNQGIARIVSDVDLLLTPKRMGGEYERWSTVLELEEV